MIRKHILENKLEHHSIHIDVQLLLQLKYAPVRCDENHCQKGKEEIPYYRKLTLKEINANFENSR